MRADERESSGVLGRDTKLYDALSRNVMDMRLCAPDLRDFSASIRTKMFHCLILEIPFSGPNYISFINFTSV